MTLADLHFSERDRIVVAVVSGEIDMSNSEELALAITQATPNEAMGVALDLSAVVYLDSAGIHLIYRLRESLRTRGQTLRLVIPSDSPVRDALRLAGVESHMEILPTLDEAVAELRGAAG